jgi:hypothetical protein
LLLDQPHLRTPCLHAGVPTFVENIHGGMRFGTQA